MEMKKVRLPLKPQKAHITSHLSETQILHFSGKEKQKRPSEPITRYCIKARDSPNKDSCPLAEQTVKDAAWLLC